MNAVRRSFALCAVLVSVTISFAATSTTFAAEAKSTPPKTNMLVIGDSLAFGFQFTTFLAAGMNDPAAYTGFADFFLARVQATAVGAKTTLTNFGCPGETTDTFLDGGCPWLANGGTLHVSSGAPTQMTAAEQFLRSHRGRVGPVLLSLGANDLIFAVAGAGTGTPCDVIPLPDVPCLVENVGLVNVPSLIAGMMANYTEILFRLRAAAPDTEIVVLLLYNPIQALLLTNPPAEVVTAVEAVTQLITAVNAQITAIAGAHRALVADPTALFDLNPLVPPGAPAICVLTGICGNPPDVHATIPGYMALADLLFEAAGYTRFEH